MPEITVLTPNKTYVTETIKFSGGEPHVKLPDVENFTIYLPQTEFTVVARLQSCEDIIRLLMTHQIIEGHAVCKSSYARLLIPYFPFARQDRQTEDSVAFSLSVMADLINHLKFDSVQILDPHSDVATALVHRVDVISQLQLIKACASRYFYGNYDTVVVSPDAGAMKKSWKVASYFKKPIVTGIKHRDVTTGEISGVSITDPGLVHGKTCFIPDDLCDGGRTFIELAGVLKDAGAARIILYITHGIFAKGLKVFDGLIDEIVTTDSFLSQPVLDEIARQQGLKTDRELYGDGTRLFVHRINPTYQGVSV